MTPDNRYLFRVPLLDPKQHVIGYRLACQATESGGDNPDRSDSQQLLSFISERIGEIKSGLIFVDSSAELLSDEVLKTNSPRNMVHIVGAEDLLESARQGLLQSLHERGMVFALRDADLAFLKENQAPVTLVSYVLVCFDHPDLIAITRLARQRQGSFLIVVENVPGWQEFDACAAMGVHGLFENLCLAPREMNTSQKLGPQAKQILQLMQMVQENVDIRHLEKILKSDVTLSFKLLRYINSAGFGLEVEIESPRHAVAMLGYSPLFRWLLLLLARTNATGFSPALMQAAMVRGRFAELLGQDFLSKREAENLFVVGMFSFLDHLLGIPIHEVLSQLTLAEAVTQALLSYEGVYGPVLELAESSERQSGKAAELAAGLSMTAEHVNHAHLSALAWAQNIKI